jgi:hypothetical protein
MRRFLTILAAGGALALVVVAAPTNADARYYGYRPYHHNYHYGWRAFHGSLCDFRNFGRDRQLQGTC